MFSLDFKDGDLQKVKNCSSGFQDDESVLRVCLGHLDL